MRNKLIPLLLPILAFNLTGYSQVLDSSFGTNGVVTIPFDDPLQNSNSRIYSICQQQDTKIIGVGNNFYIVRFNLNGAIDSSFGINGRVKKILTLQGSNHSSNVIVQPDQKLIVTGTANQLFAITRLNKNGSDDSSFNGTGSSVINTGEQASCNSSVLQVDGKVVMCGESGSKAAWIRFNHDGTLDSSFSDDGILVIPYGNFSSGLKALKVKPDGKIIACGDASLNGTRFLLVQLLPNGQLDSAFGTNGAVITNIGGFAHDLAIQTDGKIVVVGRDVFSGGLMARFQSDGSYDSSFGTDGQISITHPDGRVGTEQVEIDSDGKIYSAGYIDSGNEEMFLIRFNNNGSIDNEYAPNGILTSLSPRQERAHSLLIQHDGRILMAGFVSINSNLTHLGLLRFWHYRLSISPSVGKELAIEVFPNPARDKLHIVIREGFENSNDNLYSIVNTVGQEMLTGRLINKTSIDISNIPSGVYILNIHGHVSGLRTYTCFFKL